MFSCGIKCLSFRCQTLKFSRPNVNFYFSTLLKGKMFLINKEVSAYCEIHQRKRKNSFMAKQLSLGSIPSDNGQENFKVWHLKLTRLTSHENMFCLRAFTGRCNRWYHRREIKTQLPSYLPSQSFHLQQSSSYKKHTTTRLKNNIKMTMTYKKTYGRSFNQLWQTNIPAQSWNYLYTAAVLFPSKEIL